MLKMFGFRILQQSLNYYNNTINIILFYVKHLKLKLILTFKIKIDIILIVRVIEFNLLTIEVNYICKNNARHFFYLVHDVTRLVMVINESPTFVNSGVT